METGSGGVCYQNGELVKYNNQVCKVTNKKIADLLASKTIPVRPGRAPAARQTRAKVNTKPRVQRTESTSTAASQATDALSSDTEGQPRATPKTRIVHHFSVSISLLNLCNLFSAI